MNPRFLILLTTLAFLGFSGSTAAHPCQPGETPEVHKHCRGEVPDPDPEPVVPAEYTAELTTGDFVFGELTGLTSNRKGTGLPGNGMLEMDPAKSGGQDQWDTIFDACLSLVTDGQITGFQVSEGNWTINYTKSREGGGNIHITMRNLVIQPSTSVEYDPDRIDFDFDLHGAVAEGYPFLPDKEDFPSVFILDEYMLWAGVGGQGGFTCNSDGRQSLNPYSTLEITRTK
jgi:hypothetical protein